MNKPLKTIKLGLILRSDQEDAQYPDLMEVSPPDGSQDGIKWYQIKYKYMFLY